MPLLAKVTFAQILNQPASDCARACRRPEVHRTFVEWNYGPVDHEHLHVQGSKEKRNIATPLWLAIDAMSRASTDRRLLRATIGSKIDGHN